MFKDNLTKKKKKKSPLKEQCWKFLDINVQTKMNYNLHAQVMHYLIQKRL